MTTIKKERLQFLAVALLALLIAFARAPDRLVHGFLWAEDGQFYLSTARALGFKSLFFPYAGYLSVIPHMIATVVVKFGGLRFAPILLAWASAAVLSMSCAYLFCFAKKRLPLLPAWLFGLMPVLVPLNGEVFLNITNLQWLLSVVLLVLLAECLAPVGEQELPRAQWLRLASILLLTLTGPYGVIYSPLIVAGLVFAPIVRRSVWAWLQIGAYLISVIVQAALIVMAPALKMAGTPGPRAALSEYLHYPWAGKFLRFFTLDYLMPSSWIEYLGQHWGYAAEVGLLSTIAVLLTAGRKYRLLCIILYGVAVGLWVIAIWRLGDAHVDRSWTGRSARYFYAPVILLCWALLISVSTTRLTIARFVGGTLLVLVALTSINRFAVQVYPRPDPVFDSKDDTWTFSVAPSEAWTVSIKASADGP